MIKDLIKYVSKNLMLNLTRSSLTILSILMGIMAIFALLSFGQGLTAYIDEVAEDMGTDNLIAQPQGSGPPGSTGTFLSKDDLEFIKKQRGVFDATPFIMQYAEIRDDPDKKGKWVFATGMATSSDEIKFAQSVFSAFEIDEGRDLRSGDSKKAVVGNNYRIANKIFSKPLGLGDKIYVNDEKYEIIGFYAEIGNPQDDANVIISLDDAEALFDTKDKYQMIYLKAEAGVAPSDLAEKLTEKLRKDKGFKEGQEDFSITTLESQLETFNQIFGVLNGILVLIAGISILVAAVNIANTMYTSVLERTKEIGIMKAIGAVNGYIMSVFVIESGFLGIFGGIVGVLVGYIIASVAGKIIAAAGYSFLKPIFPTWLTVGCILFAGIVGTLSGFLPAKQASALNPVDALRED